MGQPHSSAASRPKSAIFAPLLAGRARSWASSRSRTWTASTPSTSADVSLLTTLAASLSVACAPVALIDETRQRVAELGTINSVGEALTARLEVGRCWRSSARRRATRSRPTSPTSRSSTRSRGSIEFPYYVERGTHERQEPLRLGERPDARGSSSDARRCCSTASRTGSTRRTGVGTRARSYLGVPILVGDRAIGAISVQSTTSDSRFGDADAQPARDDRRERRRRGPERPALRRDAPPRATRWRPSPTSGARSRRRSTCRGARGHRLARHALLQRRCRAPSTCPTRTARLPGGRGAGRHRRAAPRLPITRATASWATWPSPGRPRPSTTPCRDPRAMTIEGTRARRRDRLMAAPLVVRGPVAGMLAMWRHRLADAVQQRRPELPGRARRSRRRSRSRMRACSARRRSRVRPRSRPTRPRAASWRP